LQANLCQRIILKANNIDKQALPSHIAIIMDGNGRWANQKGFQRVFGHKNAIKAVRDSTEACAELGVAHLTLYTFSTENWNRPTVEVKALMQLLMQTIKSETKTLLDNNIKFNTIGEIEKLPTDCLHLIEKTKKLTENNSRMTLTLALSYSGKQEILTATKQIAKDVLNNKITLNELNEETYVKYLDTCGTPNPELMIRTGGEHRISNFLLWQLAYTELYFTDVLWPDFRRTHLYTAIENFQQRERRFGKTSEQVSA